MRQGGISEGQSTWEFQACGQPIDGKVIGKKWAAKHDGSSIDANKVKAMVEWPMPKSVKEARGFLGLTVYYRRFINGYRIMAKPLTELLKKDQFLWNPQATTTFEELKQAMSTTPILALPNFDVKFIIKLMLVEWELGMC
uniref:Uncharacterized mitochondrial protein AtMg00860-like n=1 Tax=Nicotiana tabacum TaxID=4097 RepID=A0A1S4D6W7_TOBAC|nr:PREDICTED: uncharacterized mitochondrial protein AtMg00860-like [Nicotiana tabacum]